MAARMDAERRTGGKRVESSESSLREDFSSVLAPSPDSLESTSSKKQHSPTQQSSFHTIQADKGIFHSATHLVPNYLKHYLETCITSTASNAQTAT